MNKNKTFCEECREDVSYSIIQRIEKHKLKGDDIEYEASIAVCDKCNSDVYVGELMDAILKALYDAYRVKNIGCISRSIVSTKYALYGA